MKYRKKPVVIEAVQYDRNNWEEIQTFAGDKVNTVSQKWDFDLVVYTLEGTMKANRGDWIIKGIQGEFYPCKPDIFEMTYEKVEE